MTFPYPGESLAGELQKYEYELDWQKQMDQPLQPDWATCKNEPCLCIAKPEARAIHPEPFRGVWYRMQCPYCGQMWTENR